MVEDQFMFAFFVGLLVVYIINWFLMRRQPKRVVSAYDAELQKVLYGDEYKVKGRFE